MSDQPRVAAVLVSYNRRDLLEAAITALVSGERLPEALVVVDNGSDDGSVSYLHALRAELETKLDYELVELPQNTGGAGGFTVGMAHALAHHDPDLLWVMDDDTEPHRDTLQESLKLWQSYPQGRRPALIASRVLWHDGREHPMNRPRTRWRAGAGELAQAQQRGARPVRSASFVSLLIDAQAVRHEGLPVAAYFLWNDDFEFSARLARGRLALSSDRSTVTHRTKVFDSNTVDIGERFYFEVRNKLWMFSRSRSLTAQEKLLYGLASLRRWGLMILRSSDKPVVLRAGARGLRDGLLRSPQSNEQVLAKIHDLPKWQLGSAEPQAGVAEPFSVLLPVYSGDSPEMFQRAVVSAGAEQTLPPAEIVVVRDGPVPEPLEAVLRAFEADPQPVPLRVLRMPAAQGLAGALDAGLAECRNDIVARMDADDVCLPERFEYQLPYLRVGYDIVGSAIEEIGAAEDEPLAYRRIPTDPAEISANTGFRSPFHHPSVVYRRSAVQAVGGYGDLLRMEDFWLWLRLLRAGYRGVNLPEPLVRYRVSAGAYQRRGGPALLGAELRLQLRLLRAGYITPVQWLRNVLVRCLYRLIPTGARKIGYRAVFSRRSAT
ncbi:glycosyltransferase [Acaricomes phytoseiuli]|uniref:glycosyltransferase n=1 Tax=Acaricomes phytoseiuli TaxID=291968 RepID=UPI0022228CF2|nr:glycosyltransferase [Acaricomes phytoseiuli]MCW1248718.1 glycosyltransferase [Acaricomes phytoseiuli]